MGGVMCSDCKCSCGGNFCEKSKRSNHRIDEEELCESTFDIWDPTKGQKSSYSVPSFSQHNLLNGISKPTTNSSPKMVHQFDSVLERAIPDTLADMKWDSKFSPRQIITLDSKENSEVIQKNNTVQSTLQNQITSQNNLRLNTNTNSQIVRTIPAGTGAGGGGHSDHCYSLEAQQASPLHKRHRMNTASLQQLQRNKPVINVEFLDKAQISIVDAQELGASVASGLTHETYFDTQDGMLIHSKLTAVNSMFHATQENNF